MGVRAYCKSTDDGGKLTFYSYDPADISDEVEFGTRTTTVNLSYYQLISLRDHLLTKFPPENDKPTTEPPEDGLYLTQRGVAVYNSGHTWLYYAEYNDWWSWDELVEILDESDFPLYQPTPEELASLMANNKRSNNE